MSDPSPLLRVHDLARHYHISRGFMRKTATVRALDGVSFDLAAGSTLAVVGESGCGKSTLARQVTMIEHPDAGSIVLDGHDIAHASAATRRRLRPLVQMVFQNPYASLNPRKRIETLLAEPLRIQGDGEAAEHRVAARQMLMRVGMRPEHLRRYPHMFSGGQRQRVAIARALMLHPRLVVADEPVSALDVSVQAQVLNLLMDLQQDLGIAYLFISHNLSVVRHIAETVLVMYLGRAVEYGPRRQIFAAPAHPYTRALLAATPVLAPRRGRERGSLGGELPSPLNPPSGCAFHKRCPFAVARCSTEVPGPTLIGEVEVACHRATEIN